MRGLAMLRRRHIAVLWVGECLSEIGDYFYLVAVMWTAAKLAGSAAGLVSAAESGAALAFATLGGVVADRFDRRWAMVAADLVRGLTLAVLGVFALRGALGVVPMVMAALVLGTFEAMFTPALLASIPALVAHPREPARVASEGVFPCELAREPARVASEGVFPCELARELQATNGLMDSTRRIARAVGPSLAGAVAAMVSIGSFFLIDALSFCASGAAVFALGPRFAWKAARDDARELRGAAGAAGARGIASDIADALRVVASHKPAAWALALLLLVNSAWAAGFQVGGVLLASRELATGVAGYGYLVGAYGAGNVAGNLVIGSVHVERRLATIFSAPLILGTGFLVLASAHSLPVAMAGAAIAAIGGPMGALPLVALLQTEFPQEKAGRIFSLRFMIEHAGVAGGLVLAAPLFAVVPVRVGIAACGALLLSGGIAGLVRFGVAN